MGPASVIDMSYSYNWEEDAGRFEYNMSYCMFHSSVALKGSAPFESLMPLAGPYLPGGLLGKLFKTLQYTNQWRCNEGPVVDGWNCTIIPSVFGITYDTVARVFEGGPQAKMFMVRRDGGRKWVRDTFLAPPWLTNDWEYQSWTPRFHTYNVLRIKDGDGKIDEDNYEYSMDKLSGQDIIYFSPDLKPQ